MRVLVTGAGGFVGRHLVTHLCARGHHVRALTTAGPGTFSREIDVRQLPSHGQPVVATELADIEAIIHLAARAHVLREGSTDPLLAFRRANVLDTVELAKRAAATGVRRMVFVSSIGVNGNRTTLAPFTESDPPAPVELYAVSKWEAEQALRDIEAASRLELTIVRPPLVYGPGVRGNFLRLLRLVDSGIPLPLRSVANSRSYVGVDNLCDFLVECVERPAAAGQLFLLADGEDVSTPHLIALLAASMGRRARLFSCPQRLLSSLAAAVGWRAELERLTSSLVVSAAHARTACAWMPRRPLEDGIAAMARWYTTRSRTRAV